jgi:DNA replication licensing factor MCM3
MDENARDKDEYDTLVRFFTSFLVENSEKWESKMKLAMSRNQTRISVDLQDLEKAKGTKLVDAMLKDPIKYIPTFEEALFAFVKELDAKFAGEMKKPIKIAIEGGFGRHHMTPRGLNSGMLGKLVCIEGVVTKAAVGAPKLIQSIHYCEATGKTLTRDHKDHTALGPLASAGVGGMPKKDDENNDIKMEIGLSVYKDTQKIMIQEAPENAPTGVIPRSVEVVVEDDLVDKAKPGDRIRCVGVYRSFPRLQDPTTNGCWPSRIIANSVKNMQKDVLDTNLTGDDIREIRKIASRPDLLDVLTRSFAPSICGHKGPKTGLLFLMIGGVEKNLANGTHLRGDINVLMVGDPSCGKSQLLRFVMNIAPLSVSTTGRGSSGVGLTAAVVREPGGENHLEAGAMVLADRGIVCIDEFDKMGETDRVAIHEAMEQQSVTIAKAGMHTTLNARCSVVAAANPRFGSFDPTKDIATNINLPDSLLSRFDLIFVVRDLTTEVEDRKIAGQVLKQAMYRSDKNAVPMRGVEAVHSRPLEREEEKAQVDQGTEVWETKHPAFSRDANEQILTMDFLRKFIKFCKNRAPPILSKEASEEIAERYVNMRLRFQQSFLEDGEKKSGKLAVTTRTLEALIRLSTAHAKLKLRGEASEDEPGHVTVEDVVIASNLLLSAREEAGAPCPDSYAEAGEEADEGALDEAVEEDDGAPIEQGRQKRQKRGQAADADDGIAPQRLEVFRTILSRTFTRGQESQTEASLQQTINDLLGAGEAKFTTGEFEAGLMLLEGENKILRAGGNVFIVS